jgi:hypothetical protein
VDSLDCDVGEKESTPSCWAGLCAFNIGFKEGAGVEAGEPLSLKSQDTPCLEQFPQTGCISSHWRKVRRDQRKRGQVSHLDLPDLASLTASFGLLVRPPGWHGTTELFSLSL